MGYLLDTSVAFEPARLRPDPGVMAKLRLHARSCALASPTWHELEREVLRLPAGQRRDELADYLAAIVLGTLPILPYDQAAAAWHARERARLEAEGISRSYAVGQIAAVAGVHGLVVVTADPGAFACYRELPVERWHEGGR
ncbi:MAG TPA: PIN domain-containing protein [Terriglobales bacterium]|nr:PIN domain-containing protein [Terriglobales bacterium]